MTTTSRRYNLKTVLLNLCKDMEIPAIDIPEKNLTRVQLTTRTKIVNMALRFDADQSGFQHSTPLGKISREDTGIFAELAIRNPPREITPVLSSNGIAGIQGSKSFITQKKVDIESTFLDVFGRVAKYTDKDFADIVLTLENRKKGLTTK